GSYDLVKNYFNTHQDALTTSEVLPEAVCDGLSAAIQIRGRQTVASRADIEPEPPSPGECPQPANPEAPRQGCVCSLNGCFLPDSGS
ncbi:MAG TPA: hypothetical protein VHU80_07445, partial [Polyangiaceae bacterium]|nr:hypothetical protein [Polyangiaceae bacterium]